MLKVYAFEAIIISNMLLYTIYTSRAFGVAGWEAGSSRDPDITLTVAWCHFQKNDQLEDDYKQFEND